MLCQKQQAEAAADYHDLRSKLEAEYSQAKARQASRIKNASKLNAYRDKSINEILSEFHYASWKAYRDEWNADELQKAVDKTVDAAAAEIKDEFFGDEADFKQVFVQRLRSEVEHGAGRHEPVRCSVRGEVVTCRDCGVGVTRRVVDLSTDARAGLHVRCTRRCSTSGVRENRSERGLEVKPPLGTLSSRNSTARAPQVGPFSPTSDLIW